MSLGTDNFAHEESEVPPPPPPPPPRSFYSTGVPLFTLGNDFDISPLVPRSRYTTYSAGHRSYANAEQVCGGVCIVPGKTEGAGENTYTQSRVEVEGRCNNLK